MSPLRLSRRAAACRTLLPFLFTTLVAIAPAHAQSAAARVAGRVIDPLGAAVAQASVALLRDGAPIADTTSDAQGEFTFANVAEGRYQLRASASGFEPRTTDAVFVGAGARAVVDVHLSIGAVTQHVVVTAAANELPQSQVGAAVTVIDAPLIEALGSVDVVEPLRAVPGTAIVQTGARGGSASLFLRGGASNFAKVLVDGVPANDIGGAFDFADLATTGVDRIEVTRGADSVLYGSDALSGVVSITTKRGHARVPDASIAVDGGNLATSHEAVGGGGAVARVDYYGTFSHLQTDNNVPNNAYTNNTFATRLGVALGATTVTGTVRRIGTTFGSPNAFDYFGVADDSSQQRTSTYSSIAAESRWSPRWTSTIRFGVAGQDFHYVNPAPTGTRSDPSPFANFLGNPVTITGANGFTVSGRAILDYGGIYPSTFDSTVTRRLLQADSYVRVTPAFSVTGGVRVEHEHGKAGASSETTRNNSGAFAEGRGVLGGFVFVNAGVGFDRNEVFGDAWTPRLSVAAYVRRPSATAAVADTKLTFNAGKGIKEPSLFQELSSLFAVIPPATAASLGIAPIGPERSRSVDVGVEQGFAGGRVRVRVAYFRNQFLDLIEFVSPSVLPQLGVPPAAAAASASAFGAYVNSQSNESSGLEWSGEAAIGVVRIVGSYTYLDATVTKSFSSGALRPAINPAFPGIAIGQYSPLVGARPFRRPANSGSLIGTATIHRLQLTAAGYFVGRRDDSTLLSDQFFGTSLLLPNHDLDPAYQTVDLSGSYQLHPHIGAYVTLDNAFDKRYEAVAGYPALPRTARAGVRVGF